MKTLPTFVTYKEADKEAINFRFEVKNTTTGKLISLDSSNPTAKLHDWIPGTEIETELQYSLDEVSIREHCLLSESDELLLLVVISHQGTRRSESSTIEISKEESEFLNTCEIDISPNLLSQKFFIELMLLVNPDLSVERDALSAREESTVLWTESVEVELERYSALGEVRSSDLGGAIWKFDFEIPADSSSWSQLEWNSCVSIVIDTSRRDLIIKSIELKTIMFAEMLMFLFGIIFETSDGLEKILSADKPSTFVSECKKHLIANFGQLNLSVDALQLKWKNDRQYIFQDLQRNATRILKNRARGE